MACAIITGLIASGVPASQIRVVAHTTTAARDLRCLGAKSALY